MFGELVGVWCADAWLKREQRPIQLVECGPGHGSLMADALRATRKLPGFHSAIQAVHLVEVSPHFREKQAAALRRALGEDYGGMHIEWHSDIDEASPTQYGYP
jgi:NADH dehydrogenase [ubiquinone] 1 alpha subcomplex assembly factor 7